MNTTTINHGEKVGIPFSITDANNGLAGVRVTAAFGLTLNASPPALRKVGGLPGSSADLSISSQTAAAIAGTINMLAADYTTLLQERYYISLWIDDGTGNDRCVTPGGADLVQIIKDVPRT